MRSLRTIAAAGLLSAVAGCAAVPQQDGPDEVALPYVRAFSDSTLGKDVPDGWRLWTLSRLKRATEYSLVDHDGRTVVQAKARSSASGLVHPLALDPQRYPLLSWQWKVTDLIATADNTKRHTEDSPVRIVVSFDGDHGTLPMEDRMFFDNIRLFTGQQLPYATLMYIWENRAAKGTVIPNLHTSRIKMIVAESGRENVGNWQDVTRNVYDDFRRAFGEEPGRIIAIGVMTDTDNTGDNAHAYYGDIVFRRIAPPRLVFASD